MKKNPFINYFFTPILLILIPFVQSHATDDPEQKSNLLHKVNFGILAHDVSGLWSGFDREEGIDLNLEAILEPSYMFLGGMFRPALGGSINTKGDTSKGYFDIRWQFDFTTRLFLAIGIGAAIHNGKRNFVATDRKALGSRVLFHVPIELGYYLTPRTSVSVYFDHISNANTAKENEGLDTLGIRFGYLF